MDFISNIITRKIAANWRGHDIVVENSWGQESLRLLLLAKFSEATVALADKTVLSIDGNQVSTTDKLILMPNDEPIVSGTLMDEGIKHVVTVFAKAGLTRNLFRVCVDGEQIAGDKF